MIPASEISEAVATWLATRFPAADVNVYEAGESTVKELPAVIVETSQIEEHETLRGNFDAVVSITLQTQTADQSKSEHEVWAWRIENDVQAVDGVCEALRTAVAVVHEVRPISMVYEESGGLRESAFGLRVRFARQGVAVPVGLDLLVAGPNYLIP